MTNEEHIEQLKKLRSFHNGSYGRSINKAIEALKQEPKTGRWITWKEAENEIASETRFECSVCHDSAQTLCNGLDLLSPYCPNCGAKMVEPQESEEQA